MAKVKKKPGKTFKKTIQSPFGIYWEKKNYIFLFTGFILLIVGFYVMSIGQWDSFPSLVISPIILIIAYILIFPASIFYKKKDEKVNTEENDVASG